MVDLNSPIYNWLKDIAKTQLEFPDTNAKFPIITITEITNNSDFEVDNVEKVSDVTYQIDVWDNGINREKCEQIAILVNKRMNLQGFKRTVGRGFRDPSGLHRKMMYFNSKIINL